MLAENVSCAAGGLQQEEFYLRKNYPGGYAAILIWIAQIECFCDASSSLSF
jgi:hypothetical protein